MKTRSSVAGIALGLIATILSGCSEDGTYRLHLIFPCQADEARVTEIDVWALASEDVDCSQLLAGDVQDPCTVDDACSSGECHGTAMAPDDTTCGDGCCGGIETTTTCPEDCF